MDLFEQFLLREAAKMEAKAMLRPPRSGADWSNSSEHQIARQLVKILEDFPLFRNLSLRSITQSKEAALSRVYEKILNSRKALGKLEYLLVSLLANPVTSIVRWRRGNDLTGAEEGDFPASSQLPYAEAAALFLHEVCQSEEEIGKLVEELKCAFSMQALRPSLQTFLHAWKQYAVERTIAIVRKDLPQCVASFQTFPRRVILAALKLHVHSAIASALMSIAFAKPPIPGGTSLFQQFLRVGFKLDSISNELDRIALLLPSAQVASHLQSIKNLPELAEFDQVATEDGVEQAHISFAKREMVMKTLTQSSLNRETFSETQQWTMLRYVELLVERDNQQALLDIFGEEDFCKQLLREMLLGGRNKKLFGLVFERGSGLVKFCESLFDSMEQALRDAEECVRDDAELKLRYLRIADDLMNRALLVLHNMLQLDREGALHDLFLWILGFYAECAKRVALPTLAEQISSITVAGAGDATCEAEIANVAALVRAKKWDAKAMQLPQSVLRLVQQYRLDMQRLVLSIHVPIPFGSSPHHSTTNAAAMHISGALMHIDVCWNVADSRMLDRGFMKRGVVSSTTSVWTKQQQQQSGEATLHPITNVAVAFDEHQPSPSSSPVVWETIPKNLNKGTWGTFPAYLRIQRERNAKTVVTDMRLLDANSPVNKALAGSWHFAGSFRNGLVSSMNVWILFQPV